MPNANELEPLEELSNYFPDPPVKGMVHLIVRLPPGEYTLSVALCLSSFIPKNVLKPSMNKPIAWQHVSFFLSDPNQETLN